MTDPSAFLKRVGGAVVPTVLGAPVATLKQNNFSASSATFTLGRVNTRVYAAQKFTASSSYRVLYVASAMLRVLNPTYTVKMSIYSHNSGSNIPSTKLGESSSFSPQLFSSVILTDFNFTGLNVPLVNGTIYWGVIQSSSFDANNFSPIMTWLGSATGFTAGFLTSDDGSNWSAVVGSGLSLSMKIFGV